MSTPLSFEFLRKSLNALERDLNFVANDKSGDPLRFESSRSAAVHSFQSAYDRTIQLIKRVLKENSDDPGQIDHLSPDQRIREASKQGLIDPADIPIWIETRHNRNTIAHEYSEEDTQAIFDVLPEFKIRAEKLLIALEKNS